MAQPVMALSNMKAPGLLPYNMARLKHSQDSHLQIAYVRSIRMSAHWLIPSIRMNARWRNFSLTNITTGIQVAHARGVIMLALAQKGLQPAAYTPSQVKQSVVGYGKAEKRQVMEMTKTMLGLSKVPRPDDAADALAVAICHGHTGRSKLWER